MSSAAFVCTCNKCGHKDYRLQSTQNQLGMLSGFAAKGQFQCYHCHDKSSNMSVKQLKWKDIKKLHKKFPNKKAIFTTFSVDELLKLPDDTSPDPNLKTESEEMKNEGGQQTGSKGSV